MKPEYLILDLETTGTSPLDDYILEVGAILVDGDLREIARFHHVARYVGDPVEHSALARDMHEANGLWRECRQADMNVPAIDQTLARWLKANKAEGVQLAGGSIHFDRSFMQEDMPRSLALLHYRQVDISGVARELRLCGVAVQEFARGQHRAIPDCVSELQEWRALRETVRRLGQLSTRPALSVDPLSGSLHMVGSP